MERKNETPSKSKIVNKVLTSSINNCDSPFRLLPNISTPPSRFSKILNPFESNLIERLHLPTFSPSVFAQVSTPKTDKFKWTIDDISSFKPADIDENTISQHVVDQDPIMESLVQEKIDTFFKEKSIVPSPLNEQIKSIPLITSSMIKSKPACFDSCAQTVLTLPPVLPKHLEEALAPYFAYTEPQFEETGSLYRKLFDFDEGEEHSVHPSVESSPAPSTGLSPIQLSPDFDPGSPSSKRTFDGPVMDLAELRDCTLSPIGRSPVRESRSACRLSFSEHMSLDASLVVPDVNRSLNVTNLEPHDSLNTLPEPPAEDAASSSSMNWELEYKQISEMIDSSNSNTPHSKMFTSLRKRLSDSFKVEEFVGKDVEMMDEGVLRRGKSKVISNESTDPGYHTGGLTICENSVHMFASTPTKIKN